MLNSHRGESHRYEQFVSNSVDTRTQSFDVSTSLFQRTSRDTSIKKEKLSKLLGSQTLLEIETLNRHAQGNNLRYAHRRRRQIEIFDSGKSTPPRE